MDEEEELENTLIGQEEEAPAINTGDALMGAGQPMFTADSNVVAAVPGIENIRNPGAFNPANVEPVEPAGSELGYFQRLGEFAKSALNRDQGLFDVDRLGTAADDLLGSAMRNLTPAEDRRFANNEPFGKTFTDTFAITRPDGTKFYPDEVTSPSVTAQAPSGASALVAPPSVTPPVERPAAGAQDQPGTAVSPFLQSPDTPSGLGGPLLRGFEMVNDAARGPNAPMGRDATRARLGGMTLNEYLNAPAGTPGVSGLRTDPQGRMITPTPQLRVEPEVAQPAVDSDIIPAVTQAPVDSAVPTTVAQPPVGALSDFEKQSLARQQRIGGTGSFAGDSAAREARLAERDRLPGETQTERDTRIAQSRTTGGQTEGLSFDDARRRAEGQLAARGVRNPSASQVNALARGIQAAEPERLEALKTQRAINEARLKTAQATLDRPEFEGKVYTVNGVTFAQTSRGGAQVIDTGAETPEQSTAQIQNFEFTLDQIDKAREAYSAGNVDRANDILTAAGIQKNGIDVTANEYFGDLDSQVTPSDSTPQVTVTQFDPSQLTGQDREAYNFAINNPNDERSQKILNKLGAN